MRKNRENTVKKRYLLILWATEILFQSPATFNIIVKIIKIMRFIMTRYNKTNVITMVKSLQTNEIPAFLEKISAHLEKMPQPELNEITATVIGCMMPPDKSCELSQFEEVMALTKKYFGARAFASLFSKWVQKNITDKDFMAFLEKHVKDITDIYSYPASLLNFLCETMNILFQKYRDFNTYELTHELRTYDDKDECEQSVHAAYASKNFRLFPSSQLIEICDKHGFMRTEKNNNIISAFKEKFDKAASAVAVQNFTVANKVIALFADEFAAISDPTVLNTYLASLVHHEGEVRGNLV